MKIAILGTGISGLSIAQMLKDKHSVSLFEIQAKIGGLIKCERINDCLFHKVGGHVFNAKNPMVLEWFWSFFNKEEEFVKTRRNAKVYFGGNIIGYPIENYLYNFSPSTIKDIISELTDLQKLPYKAPFEYENFEEFLKGNFGDTLFKVYFEPYNKKIWKTDLKKVAMEWLEGKLPMPNFKEIITSNILRKEEEGMVHSTFFYPKFNGSQFLVDRLSNGLNISPSFHISDLNFANNKIRFNGTEVFDKVVYTGDIRKLPRELDMIIEDAGIDLRALKALKSNGTSNLFCETDETDLSWLYIPEPFTKAHRIIYTGNFSVSNNQGSSRKTCVVEFSGKVDYEEMVEEIKKLPGNLVPITHNYEANSYVIQDQGTRKLISDTKKVLKEKNVYLLGRFAEWEYYNMDKAIEAAMLLRDEIA